MQIDRALIAVKCDQCGKSLEVEKSGIENTERESTMREAWSQLV